MLGVVVATGVAVPVALAIVAVVVAVIVAVAVVVVVVPLHSGHPPQAGVQVHFLAQGFSLAAHQD